MVASWLSGYGGYSETPWVQILQLLVFRFSPFSLSRLNSKLPYHDISYNMYCHVNEYGMATILLLHRQSYCTVNML